MRQQHISLLCNPHSCPPQAPLSARSDPVRVDERYPISALATLAQWLNAAGFLFQASSAAYALTFTWFLVLSGRVFVQNLEFYIGHKPLR